MALRASDIDFAIVNGLGFPAWRGGPLYYCDQQGLARMTEAIEKHGGLAPALLGRLAAQGKRMTGESA